jgi:lipoyl(octanoyl) transferase
MVDMVGGKAIVWIDGPERGAWNMAMDQAMALHAAEQDCIILRIYQWAYPTLSLGYFQSHEDRLGVPGLEEIDCVRRETGGGAIVHDQEITYSIAVPRRWEGSMRLGFLQDSAQTAPNTTLNHVKKSNLGHSDALYRAIHDRTVQWLRRLGFDAKTFSSFQQSDNVEVGLGLETKGSELNPKSFLCFDRRSSVDIVVGSEGKYQKVLGSAQRRTSGALLQHGSLLLSQSIAALHLTGLDAFGLKESAQDVNLASSKINAKKWSWAIDFCRVLQDSVEDIWNCDWQFEEQSESVNQLARAICDEKFGTHEWTFRRSASENSV